MYSVDAISHRMLHKQDFIEIIKIGRHTPSKEWGEITYPFPNFNGRTVQVWEGIGNFTSHFIMGVIFFIHSGNKVNPC